MKLNFKNISIVTIEGDITTVDISKELGGILYKAAISPEALQMARDLYAGNEIEVTKDIAQPIKDIINSSFLAIVQEAINPILDQIIGEEENDQPESVEQ